MARVMRPYNPSDRLRESTRILPALRSRRLKPPEGKSARRQRHCCQNAEAWGRYYQPETLRTKSAVFFAATFFSKLARWNSTVRGLISRKRAISLLECPTTISARIPRSLGVRVPIDSDLSEIC